MSCGFAENFVTLHGICDPHPRNMRIFIHASRRALSGITALPDLMTKINKLAAGNPVVVSEKIAEILGDFLPDMIAVSRGNHFEAEIALSIGGDGTFLRTAQWVGAAGVPILGINAGHLGYLADMTPEEFIRSDMKDLRVDSRMLLQVESTEAFPAGFHPFALNEVALLKTDSASMITVNAAIDGLPLTAYRADGLLISTPTGSTGYNLSVGGPIVEPSVRCLTLAPIAPHSLTMRPLIVGPNSRISLQPSGRTASCLLSIDGRSISLSMGTTITLSRAPFEVKILQRRVHHFAATLRSKLFWGM